MGRVSLRMALLGARKCENRTSGLMNSKQYPATNPNWTNVRVMGYLNWMRIALPVLEERADDVYQRAQRRTKRTEDGSGSSSGIGGTAFFMSASDGSLRCRVLVPPTGNGRASFAEPGSTLCIAPTIPPPFPPVFRLSIFGRGGA